MAKALKFKKLYFKNPYKIAKRVADREFSVRKNSIVEREAAEVRLIARRSMRKAPNRPKTRFGQYREYGQNTKAYQKGRRSYYQKGLYSRPGHPPFHHGQSFNLRSILYKPIQGGSYYLRTGIQTTGAYRLSAWRVGPKYRPNPYQTPVPQLHEFGGKVRIRKQAATYSDRGHVMFRRPGGTGTLTYPPRPYMRPAGKIARARAEERFEKYGKLKGLYLKRFTQRKLAV